MLDKYLLLLLLSFSQMSLAFVPKAQVPPLPEMPIFGDFNPNQLRKNFNQFIHGVAPNYGREDRVISEIEDSVLEGDVEYLTLKNGREVFSIFMQSEAEKSKGGAIILHNRGHHANWFNAIKPIRVGLAEKGWDTLSVQMPILDKTARYYDYVPIFPYAHARIKAAIDFYQQRGVKNIILIAHGCGAHMSMSYIDRFGDTDIRAFVGIGMGATDYKQKLVKPYPLEKMRVPILDIFAENDFPGVLRLAQLRRPRLNKNSAQMLVKDADHYYQEGDSGQRLTNKIGVWLTQIKR